MSGTGGRVDHDQARPGRCAAPVHALGLAGDGSLMAKLRVCMTDREVKSREGKREGRTGL